MNLAQDNYMQQDFLNFCNGELYITPLPGSYNNRSMELQKMVTMCSSCILYTPVQRLRFQDLFSVFDQNL